MYVVPERFCGAYNNYLYLVKTLTVLPENVLVESPSDEQIGKKKNLSFGVNYHPLILTPSCLTFGRT